MISVASRKQGNPSALFGFYSATNPLTFSQRNKGADEGKSQGKPKTKKITDIEEIIRKESKNHVKR